MSAAGRDACVTLVLQGIVDRQCEHVAEVMGWNGVVGSESVVEDSFYHLPVFCVFLFENSLIVSGKFLFVLFSSGDWSC